MATTTPTTKELSDNIIAQLESTLNQTIPLLPKSFNRVLSRAIAGVYIVLYKYIGFGILQGFVATASAQETVVNGTVFTPLFAWGELIGIGLPAPATQAELEIQITVTNPSGSLPAGSQLIYQPTGVTYITLTTVLLNSANVNAVVRAVADQQGGNGSGVQGNLPDFTTLSFANPLANVLRDTVVVDTVTVGADGEGIEVYRQRIQDKFSARPQGGALADYRIWAEEPAGILNAYPYTDSVCPGQVKVFIESATEPDGIPDTAQLEEALASINFDENGLANRRPVSALANTFSITRTEFDVTVTGLVVEDTAEVQAQITEAVTEYFVEREPFITGLSVPPRLDRITATGVGGIVDSIVSAAGGVFQSVTLLKDAVSIQQYTLGEGEKSKVSNVNFV